MRTTQPRPPTARFRRVLLAFAIPFAAMLGVYAAMGMYPFGSRCILTMDMSDQNVNFMVHWRAILSGEASIFYSWAKGLGGDFIGVFAEIMASPLNLLTILFPKEMMPMALMLLTCLKLGLAGAAMAHYLGCISRRHDAYPAAFGVMYALMAYSVVYSMSIMWLDTVILLPVVLVGVERILRDEGCIWFGVSVLLLVFTSFYTGIMAGMFTVLYFGGRLVLLGRQLGRKGVLRASGGFLAAGLLSVGMMMWLLLPVYASVVGDRLALHEGRTHVFLFGVRGFALKLINGAYDSMTNRGRPNVFCGALPLVLLGVFAASERISRREKAVGLGGLAFLFLSMISGSLNHFWHLSTEPKWFPYRYSFLFSFVLLLVAFRTMREIKRAAVGRLLGGLAALAVVGLLASARISGRREGIQLLLTLGFGLAAWSLLAGVRLSKTAARTRWLEAAVVGLVSVEMAVSAYGMIRGVDGEFRYEANEDFAGFVRQLQPLVVRTKAREKELFRFVKNFERRKNDAAALGMNDFAHYSSAYSQKMNVFLRSLGYAQGYFWCAGCGGTPVTKSLFNVRYIMSRTPVPCVYVKVDQSGNVDVYRNPHALGMAYWAPSTFGDVKAPSDPMAYQNAMVRALTGGNDDCFEPVPGCEMSQEGNDLMCRLRSTGNPVYLGFQSYPTNYAVYVNDSLTEDVDRDESRHIVYCGTFPDGQRVSIFINSRDAARIAPENICVYQLNVPTFERLMKQLKRGELHEVAHGNTWIEGDLDAPEDGFAVTSIPYSPHWTVKVDGERVPTFAFQDVLLYCRVRQGRHRLLFTYENRWLKTGGWISLICLAVGLAGVGVSLAKKGK